MPAVSFVITVVLLSVHHLLMVRARQLCPQVDGNSESCVCKSPKGVIDLRPLANRNGTARFKNVNDNHYYTYDFNPCQTFQSNCINVYVCQAATRDLGVYFGIADQGTEEIWIDSVLGPYLYYTGPGSREVKVYLHCDKSSEKDVLTTTGDSKTRLTYIFDLYSCHACPGGCDASLSQSTAGMIGWGLIMLVGLSFMVYLAIGMACRRCCHGFRGRDMIPHREFWNDVPYLMQDGCLSTIESCCPSLYRCMYGGRKQNYDENYL